MSQPIESTSSEEVSVCVTNKQWECKAQFNSPYLSEGYLRTLPNDENPHHWAYKQFRVYKNSGPGLIEVNIDSLTFYARKESFDKATLWYVFRKKNESLWTWFVFAPGESDIERKKQGKDFWGWEFTHEFWAVAEFPKWICHKCTFENDKVQHACSMCDVPRQEQKEAPRSTKSEGSSTSTAPISSTKTNPDEITVFITNKKFECRANIGSPFFGQGYGYEIPGDGNPHHWAFKVFKAYKTGGPGLSKVSIGQVEFYAHEQENPQEGLSLYYACARDSGHTWWVFSPSRSDIIKRKSGDDLWGWQVTQEFYAKRDPEQAVKAGAPRDEREWACEECSSKNPGFRGDCEVCHTSRLKESKGQLRDDEPLSAYLDIIQVDRLLSEYELKRSKISQDANCAFAACADQENLLTGKSEINIPELKNTFYAALESRADLRVLFPQTEWYSVKQQVKHGNYFTRLGEIIVVALARAFRRDLFLYSATRGRQYVNYPDSDKKEGAWHIAFVASYCDSLRPSSTGGSGSGGSTGTPVISSHYPLSAPKPFSLPFKPGTPSRDSILALLPPKTVS